MAEALDSAFDAFVSARLVSWINGRVGEAQWDRNLLNGPELDHEVSPGVIVDAQGRWYRPEFTISANDAAFSFAVRQENRVEEDGDPFNRATLTLTLSAYAPDGIPADGQISALVPGLDLAANLTVPTIAPDGSTVQNRVHGTVSGGEHAFTVTFDLKGAEVIATYVNLTHRDPNSSGGLMLTLIASHLAIQPAVMWPAHIAIPAPAPLPNLSMDLPGPTFAGFQLSVSGPEGGLFGGGPPSLPSPFGMVPTSLRYFPVIARYDRTVEVGLSYFTDEYRSRFTITRDGMTRPIIDANDLSQFAGPRSEYRELTSLGPVSAKYPTLSRLYFGQVSGTVVAIPAAYGIQRRSTGLAASCDTIVDAAGITGSRFHFTFDIAPMVDPVELARLGVDIRDIPEAAGRTLRAVLPSGLDPRYASTLDGFPAAVAGFADGAGSTVQVGVEIADDRTVPATTLVNQFLHQLGANTPAPLFGNLALRLDDLFAQPVQSRLTLNLHQTADGDELFVLDSEGGTPEVVLRNDSPLDLALQRLAVVTGNNISVSSLNGQPLGKGETLTVAAETSNATGIAVSRSLSVPSPVPKATMLDYVAFHTVAVQQIQHPLTINATATDFAGGGITAIRIQMALTAHPGVAVPVLTLSADHQIDFVHVLIPIESVFSGLRTTVVLTISSAAGERAVSLVHDFMDEPILVLTDAKIAQ